MFRKYRKQINSSLRQERGFTLIETFVAITILMITVLGPMTLLSRALQESLQIKEQIIATFLAQEGVELMMDNRNKSGGDLSVGEKGDPYSCSQFYLTADEGYVCSVYGVATPFSRLVEVEPIDFPSGQYKVTSTVSWNFRGVSKSIESYSIIFIDNK
jgi:type II secretory pathway pseudopilin PulG